MILFRYVNVKRKRDVNGARASFEVTMKRIQRILKRRLDFVSGIEAVANQENVSMKSYHHVMTSLNVYERPLDHKAAVCDSHFVSRYFSNTSCVERRQFVEPKVAWPSCDREKWPTCVVVNAVK